MPTPSKAIEQQVSKTKKKCAAVEEDIETPKKKRKSKPPKDKNAATGIILDLAEFDEAQKTTVADETYKDLKLKQTVSKLTKAVDDLKGT